MGCRNTNLREASGGEPEHYTMYADDGIEVRRNDDEECVGYLPAKFAAKTDADLDDPAAVMAAEGYRELDADGDVTPPPV